MKLHQLSGPAPQVPDCSPHHVLVNIVHLQPYPVLQDRHCLWHGVEELALQVALDKEIQRIEVR